jgi:ElaB/YqjD/DUF883 family membrane-anchored ribosome-binding protein
MPSLAQACGEPGRLNPYFAMSPATLHPAERRTIGMASFTEAAMSKSEDATAQIARLREQVESLMKDRVTPAVAEAAGRAEAAMYGAADTVRGQAEAVSNRVREQPLLAILIAAGIGYALGRAIR